MEHVPVGDAALVICREVACRKHDVQHVAIDLEDARPLVGGVVHVVTVLKRRAEALEPPRVVVGGTGPVGVAVPLEARARVSMPIDRGTRRGELQDERVAVLGGQADQVCRAPKGVRVDVQVQVAVATIRAKGGDAVGARVVCVNVALQVARAAAVRHLVPAKLGGERGNVQVERAEVKINCSMRRDCKIEIPAKAVRSASEDPRSGALGEWRRRAGREAAVVRKARAHARDRPQVQCAHPHVVDVVDDRR